MSDMIKAVRTHHGGGIECDVFLIHQIRGKVDGFEVCIEVRSSWKAEENEAAKAKLVTLAIAAGLIPIGGY